MGTYIMHTLPDKFFFYIIFLIIIINRLIMHVNVIFMIIVILYLKIIIIIIIIKCPFRFVNILKGDNYNPQKSKHIMHLVWIQTPHL